MTGRKMVLLTPRLPALVANAVRALPASRMFIYGGVMLGALLLLKRAFRTRD